MHVPIPVAAIRQGSARAGYCEFEPRRGHVSLSVVSVVCCQRSLRRTDHSPRGVLPSVMCLMSVTAKPRNERPLK